MASSTAADDRRSSAVPPLNLRSDVLSIVRRSSAIFFSTTVVGPLLLSLACLLLFLFRSLILYLTFRCTASRMKHGDDPNYSIAIYYQLIVILIVAFAFFGYFILYSALHLTALLTVLSSLLNIKPPPTAESFVTTFRHGCRLSNARLLVFHETVLLFKQVRKVCAVVLLVSLTGINALSWSLRKMALGPTPFHLLDDMEGQFPVLIGAWTALEMAASVVVINLAPWVLLFLDPAADERRIGVWYTVKRGCYLMWLMFFQAMTIKIVEDIVCGELRRKDLMTVMAAGDWRDLFVVLVVKSVAEAFFTVVWLVFYVAARREAPAEIGGEAFGMQDLDNCLARLR